ncbi:hypothetical protein ABEY37_01005 [Bacillus pacificus]|uniref:hypothetical protein n=1 Tax=Bacillus pacificus TaxID=2026187 RepID=UPI003D1EA213
MKTLTKAILNALKVETEINYEIMELLSVEKRKMVINQCRLLGEIENGFITDEDNIKKLWQLIQLIHEWDVDESFDFQHVLVFDNGKVGLQSTFEDCYTENQIEFVDGTLILNDELKFDSVNGLMNYIEFNTTVNA